MIEETARNQGNIMVVDDHPANLKLLDEMLSRQNYRVRSFPLGRLALAAAAQHPPDLVLLDINMPEMDGYQVCERLKSDGRLSQIPVIFLSALSEIGDKVKAFRSGGVDYVSKPFQFEEVQARVRTHLDLYRLQQALQVHNHRLEDTVRVRTLELTEAHSRLTILDRAKSEFLNLISHEFRTPLNGILGIGELVLDELDSRPENDELRELFEQSRRRILSILDDALLLTQIEVEGAKFTAGAVPLGRVLGGAVALAFALARSRGVELGPMPAGLGLVFAEEKLLLKALGALLEAAVKFSKSGEVVGMAYEAGPDTVSLSIESQSGTIPAAAIAGFFDLLSISEASTTAGDLGLGPPVAYRILSLFGGSVRAENRPPAGIRLTVDLRVP